MGTHMAPSYANLFLAKFETNALTHASHQPHTWWRFTDDIFMIWTHTEDELRTFITYLNNIHHTIKFTSSHSTTSTSFLHIKVSLSHLVNLRPISLLNQQTKPIPSTIIVSLSTYQTSHIQPRSTITTHMFFRRKLYITRQ